MPYYFNESYQDVGWSYFLADCPSGCYFPVSSNWLVTVALYSSNPKSTNLIVSPAP